MATIPFEPLPQVQPSAEPSPYLSVRPVANAFGEEAFGQASDALAQHAIAFQGLQNETEAKESDIKFAQALTDLQMNPQTGFQTKLGKAAVDAYPEYQKQVGDLYQQFRNNLKNPQAQEMFDSVAVRRVTSTQEDLASHAATENKKWQVGTAEARIRNEVNQSATFWNDPVKFNQSIATIRDEAEQRGQMLGQSDEQIKADMGHYVSEAWQARIQSVMAHDANAAKQMFDAAGDQIDAEHRASLDSQITSKQYVQEMRAERFQEKAAAGVRVGLISTLSNAEAHIDAGLAAPQLPSDMQIAAAYPNNPDMAEQVKDRVDYLRGASTFMQALPSMTPAQIAEQEVKLRPNPDSPDFVKQSTLYKSFIGAVQTVSKKLSDDPASYFIGNDPTLSDSLSAGLKNPATFAQYQANVTAKQTAMGLTPDEQHVLPRQTAQGLAAQFVASPETAASRINQMRQSYGSSWPAMWRDIVTLGKLPGTFEAVGTLDDPKDATLLARAISEQSKSGKEWGDIIGDKQKKGIDDAVRSDPAIQQLTHSLSQSGAPVSQIGDVVKAASILGYAKSFYEQDANAGTSAAEAITKQYDFSLPGGPRVPAAKLSTVSANAEQVLQHLDENKIAIPTIFGQPGQPSKDDYIRSLSGMPTWITNPNADGLWLMDHGGRVVRDTGGNPLNVPFDAPAPDAPGGGIIHRGRGYPHG